MLEVFQPFQASEFGLGARGAAAAAENLRTAVENLFNGTTATSGGCILDPSDSSLVFQETSSPTTAADSDGDVVGYMHDASTNDQDFTAPADSQRPSLKISGGVYSINFAGSGVAGDPTLQCNMGGNLPGDTAKRVYFRAKINSSDTPYIMVGRSGVVSDWAIAGEDASSSAPIEGGDTGSVYVDGVEKTTRDAVHDALVDGAWHTVEIRNWTVTGTTFFPTLFYYEGDSNYNTIGEFAGVVMIEEGVAAAGSNHTTITDWLEDKAA